MKVFNLYCDESCHLENDNMSIMIIAYTMAAFNTTRDHYDFIKAIKQKHGFKNEIKWSSVSSSKYDFYAELIDYFFTSDLQFRAVVVEKKQIKISEGETFDDFYYKMYYQLLFHKINMEHAYYIYLDIKDTLSANKVKKLKQLLNINYTTIRELQNIRSEESVLMQITDLLMGAISYHLRELDAKNKVKAKQDLIAKIQSYAKIPLTKSTLKSFNKFNLFFIDLSKKK